MKARRSTGWVLGLAVAGGVITGGIAQEAPGPSRPSATSNSTPSLALAPAATASAKTAADKPLSSTVYASPWVDEVERLTKAGIDEGVVLSYVINSAGTFNLTADQIVRLKNSGVSPQVVSAMIQHDLDLISGARPLTASSPPSSSTIIQAVLTTNTHLAVASAALSPAPAGPAPAPAQIVANDDYNADTDWISVEPDDVPEQPASLGPVRAPYAVKLNDPIIVFRLPTFSVPCW